MPQGRQLDVDTPVIAPVIAGFAKTCMNQKRVELCLSIVFPQQWLQAILVFKVTESRPNFFRDFNVRAFTPQPWASGVAPDTKKTIDRRGPRTTFPAATSTGHRRRENCNRRSCW
jgi:hypothetical protein